MMISRLTRDEIFQLSDSVEPVPGWDFSHAKTSIDPVPWEYTEVARKFLKPTHNVLDIATGGG